MDGNLCEAGCGLTRYWDGSGRTLQVKNQDMKVCAEAGLHRT